MTKILKVVTSLKFFSSRFSYCWRYKNVTDPIVCYWRTIFFPFARSTFNRLRETCLTLPHPSYLRLLSSCFSQCYKSLTDDDAHFIHLKQKCALLTDDERPCVLMMDEIYVSRKVLY
jgi:hypothetical protein